MSGWMITLGAFAFIGAALTLVSLTVLACIGSLKFAQAVWKLVQRRRNRTRRVVSDLYGGFWNQQDREMYLSGFSVWRKMFSEHDAE